MILSHRSCECSCSLLEGFKVRPGAWAAVRMPLAGCPLRLIAAYCGLLRLVAACCGILAWCLTVLAAVRMPLAGVPVAAYCGL